MPSCSAIYNGGPCSAQKWKRRGNLTPFDCVRPTQQRIPPKNRGKKPSELSGRPPNYRSYKMLQLIFLFPPQGFPAQTCFLFFPFPGKKTFRPLPTLRYRGGVCRYAYPFRRSLFPYSINLAPKTEGGKPTP